MAGELKTIQYQEILPGAMYRCRYLWYRVSSVANKRMSRFVVPFAEVFPELLWLRSMLCSFSFLASYLVDGEKDFVGGEEGGKKQHFSFHLLPPSPSPPANATTTL